MLEEFERDELEGKAASRSKPMSLNFACSYCRLPVDIRTENSSAVMRQSESERDFELIMHKGNLEASVEVIEVERRET
jgi:hypothetical protein